MPYAFKHPRVIHAWTAIREMALADVRALRGTPERLARLHAWIERAHSHFVNGTRDDCAPFLNAVEVAAAIEHIEAAFARCRHDPLPFDSLYLWAEGRHDDRNHETPAGSAVAQARGPETVELVVSLLLELHEIDDDMIDELLCVDERVSLDPGTTVAQMRAMLASRFSWIDGLDLDAEPADTWWWVISDNNEEPRRAHRDRLEPAQRDVAIDVALRMRRLSRVLADYDDATPIHSVLHAHPEHRMAAERLSASDRIYGEPRDNACSARYLPLMLQRFQLAMYGMDNFKPKSTDWLRVTLFQGAPRLSDLSGDARHGRRGDMADDWVLPARPGRSE